MPTNTKTLTLKLLIGALLLLGLAACGSATPEATLPAATEPAAPEGALTTLDPASLTPPATPAGEAYPPAEAELAGGYPAVDPAVEAYPPPAEQPIQEPRFRIDQPVGATATTITGQAPPDVPLAVLDVTYNGALLGTGRSDANGAFSIPVTGLIEGNRIGLAIGELAEGQSLNEMAELYYPHRGEGFMNLPNVGIFFDTTLVQP